MRKNNKQVAQRGNKRHMKNVQRKRRAVELKKFNNLVGYFKYMQEMQKKQQEQISALNLTPAVPAESEVSS